MQDTEKNCSSNTKFQVGNDVIGTSFPDLIPAKVIRVMPNEFVEIQFEYNGIKTQVLPEYRLEPLIQPHEAQKL
jgi:hypothetical protein